MHTATVPLRDAELKGKALDVYSRLAIEEATNYDSLKDALLKRFHLTAIGFRQKFREIRAEQGETAPQFVARLDCTLTRWLEMDKKEKTYGGLKDLILREQFLNSSSEELRLFLNERKPKSVMEMARLAEQYADAHCIFGLPQMMQSSVKRPNQSARPPYVRKPENKQPFKMQNAASANHVRSP